MSAGVPCPACGDRASGVQDSRPNGAAIRRRRRCRACDHRFTTYETAEPINGHDVVDLGGLPRHVRTAIRVLIRGAR